MDEKEKIEIKEDKKDKENDKSVSLLSKKYKFLYYIVIFIVVLILRYFYLSGVEQEYSLGDFGRLLPLLLNMVLFTNLRWCPIFCVAGCILVFFEEKMKDLSSSFLTITGLIFVLTLVLFFIFI